MKEKKIKKKRRRKKRKILEYHVQFVAEKTYFVSQGRCVTCLACGWGTCNI